MVSVSTDDGAFQDLVQLRDRLEHRGTDLFDDNAQLRYDKLIVRLERESRGVFKTLWGDETPLTETDRVDTMRTTDDAAMALAYPVNEITEVEWKRTIGSDWEVLDADRWDNNDHRIILANKRRSAPGRRANELTDRAMRATWRDLAAKIRVTYNRGFGDEAPADIKSLQVQLINQMLRKLKREQTVAAASPEELAGMTDMNEVVTDEIRDRIGDVTSPSMATFSI